MGVGRSRQELIGKGPDRRYPETVLEPLGSNIYFILIGGHIEDIFKKKPWGFFHKFVQNAPKIYLSHSSRVLSKNALQYVHDVLSPIPTEFIVNF